MRRDNEWYWNRAKRKFKTLVIYFCVTRPQYEKAYNVNGKFSADELLRQLDFLKKWRDRKSDFRTKNAKRYASYSKAFNYTFSIPCDLIRDVLGQWKDERGRKVRINVKKLVKELKDEGFLEKCGHGTKTHKDEEGKYHVDCWWGNKYLLANRDYWFKLLSDPNYSDYTKYPEDDDGFVAETREKIAKWRKRKTSSGDASEQNEVVDSRDMIRRIFTDFLNGNISKPDAIYELRKLGHDEMTSLNWLNELTRRKQDGQERV